MRSIPAEGNGSSVNPERGGGIYRTDDVEVA
jgi:hypothetical protein